MIAISKRARSNTSDDWTTCERRVACSTTLPSPFRRPTTVVAISSAIYRNRWKREAVGAAGKRLDELQQRLAIRFGREHEVSRGYARCSDALLRLHSATIVEEDIDQQSAEAAHRMFVQARATFTDAATAYAGLELAPQPS